MYISRGSSVVAQDMLCCQSIQITRTTCLSIFFGMNHRVPRAHNILELDCEIHELTMSSLFGTSPFQHVPTAKQPQKSPGVDTRPFNMPFETGSSHVFGPTPQASPSPSRANSVRLGSAEQNSHHVMSLAVAWKKQEIQRPHRVTLE